MRIHTTTSPKGSDTPGISAAKTNQILYDTYSASLGLPPYPGGLTTLAPASSDTLGISLRKINAIHALVQASGNSADVIAASLDIQNDADSTVMFSDTTGDTFWRIRKNVSTGGDLYLDVFQLGSWTKSYSISLSGNVVDFANQPTIRGIPITTGLSLGPWTPVPPVGVFSSSIQGRWVVDPVNGLIQLKGYLSGSGFGPLEPIAMLPPGLRPAENRYMTVPSDSGSGALDSCANLVASTGGQLLIAPIGATPQVLIVCDGGTFPIN
jgi:hypothetical protein